MDEPAERHIAFGSGGILGTARQVVRIEQHEGMLTLQARDGHVDALAGLERADACRTLGLVRVGLDDTRCLPFGQLHQADGGF